MKKVKTFKLVILVVALSLVGLFSVSCKKKHVFSENWENDAEYHWHVCTTKKHDDISTKEKHTFDKGVVKVEATEEKEGEKVYTCTICKYEKTEKINKLVHTHAFDEGVVKVEPTEEKEGEIIYTCTKCGKTKTEKIPKLDHTHAFDEGVVTKEPTYTEKGEKTYTCSKCGETKTEEIPMLEAKENEIKLKEGTALNKTYDGVAFTIALEDIITNGTGKITITYKLASEDSNEYSEVAPINVGTYTVKIHVESTPEWKEVTKEETLKIDRKVLTLPESLYFEIPESTLLDNTIISSLNETNGVVTEEKVNLVVNEELVLGSQTKKITSLYVDDDNYALDITDVSKNVTFYVYDDQPFYMAIQDVFTISGKGLVISGVISRGTVRVNEEYVISSTEETVIATKIEQFRRQIEVATRGDEVGILITGATKENIKCGDLIYDKDSLNFANLITADISVKSTEESGRRTPLLNQSKYQLYLYAYANDNNVSYVIDKSAYLLLNDGEDVVMPGTKATVKFLLTEDMKLEVGMTFVIRISSKLVAEGTITETNYHTHTDDFNKTGMCDDCGINLTKLMTKENDNEFKYSGSIKAGETIYLAVNLPDVTEGEEGGWIDTIDVEGITYRIYDTNRHLVEDLGERTTADTYFIVIQSTVDASFTFEIFFGL